LNSKAGWLRMPFAPVVTYQAILVQPDKHSSRHQWQNPQH
jgi:hypothetical protein